jgi:hypothetical protein
MKKVFAYILLAGVIITGCNKKEGTSRSALLTTPFKAYVEERGLLPVELMVTSPQTFEIGYNFTVIRNQQVSKLGALMPDPGEYFVTLWKADDESVMARATIVVTGKEFTYTNISPVNLEPRTNYVLSINTSNKGAEASYFAHRLAEEPYPLYPFQLGIMSVSNVVQKHSATPSFPYSSFNDYQYFLMGIPDMLFE